MRRLGFILGFLLLVPLGCPSDAPPGDDDDAGHDDEHEHGTGEIDTHMHAVLEWGDTGELALGTHSGMYRTEAGSDDLVAAHDDGADPRVGSDRAGCLPRLQSGVVGKEK